MASPLLVFDLDGTLVDSAPDLLATLEAVLTRHGFAVQDQLGLRNGIGHGARHLIEYALHRQGVALDTNRLEGLHADFLELYEGNIAVHTRPYPGLTSVLDRFAGAGWMFAVCTNKLERLSRKLIAAVGLTDRFAAICGGDTFSASKPDPHHLLETIRVAGGSPASAVMVGDSRTDRDTAQSAGVAFVGVSFGYTPVPMAELRPDLLIESYDDLAPDGAASLFGSINAGQRGPSPAFALT